MPEPGSWDEWWQVATVNLRAPVMWTMAVLPGMRRRGSGRIINVSSPAAWHTPLPYYSSSTASKAGLSQFTAAFAREVAADGICGLAFGPVGLTDMTIGTFENDVQPEEMKDAFRAAFTTDPDELRRLTMALFRLMVRGDADHLSGGYLGAGEPTYEDASLVASLPPTEAGLQLLARRVEATPSS